MEKMGKVIKGLGEKKKVEEKKEEGNLEEAININVDKVDGIVDNPETVDKIIKALSNERGNNYVKQIKKLENITSTDNGYVIEFTMIEGDATKKTGVYLDKDELDIEINVEESNKKKLKEAKEIESGDMVRVENPPGDNPIGTVEEVNDDEVVISFPDSEEEKTYNIEDVKLESENPKDEKKIRERAKKIVQDVRNRHDRMNEMNKREVYRELNRVVDLMNDIKRNWKPELEEAYSHTALWGWEDIIEEISTLANEYRNLI